MVPMMIPIFLLGILSGIIMNRYVRAEIDHRNTEKLSGYATKTDMLLNDLEQINLSLSTNPAVTVRLKSVIARSDRGISSEDYEIINTIIDLLYSSANYNGDVDSLYVYFNNDNGYFISSTNRISNLGLFHDTGWYDSYQAHYASEQRVWTEFRDLKPYSFERNPIRVLTIYRKIFASGKTAPDGVLVLNIQEDQINRRLAQLVPIASELILAIDDSGRTVFHNSVGSSGSGSPPILNPAKYRQYTVPSALYPWDYHLLIDLETVYRIPNVLTRLTALLVLSAFGLGVIISFYFANRNYRDIRSIVDIIGKAKNGEELPSLPPVELVKKDVYSYILRSIVQTFLNSDFLRIQLSERKYYLRTMELLALQSQLNPHFLFNTMETIYWKAFALTGKPNDATAMLEHLSDIVHYALDSDATMVGLQEELAITRSYLEIQSYRYKDVFSVVWDIPEHIENLKVAKLILQPLVENCIYHGIREKKEPSTIAIRIRDRQSYLHIVIMDDGLGIPLNRLQEIRKEIQSEARESGEHIGLYNTNKRLQLIYDRPHLLCIYSRPGRGTCISIKLPIERSFGLSVV